MEPAPLTWSSALISWQWDSGAAVVIVAASIAYGRRWRRSALTARHAWWFAIATVVTAVATLSFIGVYHRTLFWVRATEVLLLLFVVPFFLAADEQDHAAAVDAELEAAEAPWGLWWQNDPQLRDRLGRA